MSPPYSDSAARGEPLRVSANAVIVREGAVLLVAFDDESGFHYNFPGGGHEPGESVRDGLRREVREETTAEVEVGDLLAVIEYDPVALHGRYGRRHKLMLFFACTLRADSPSPALPPHPDANQVAVHWLPVAELAAAPLLPHPTPALLALLLGEGLNRFYSLAEQEE